MNKTVLRCASLILVLVLAFGHFTDGRATSQNAALMPDKIVNLAFFYKPPSNSDAAGIASNFSNVVLTGGDENFRDQLIAKGFASTIPHYYRSEGIQDPGSCTASPANNQVAYKAGDFCDISKNHPDWFLLDTNGNRIRTSPTSNYWRMDPGSAGWRNFFITRLLEIDQKKGWSGVFLSSITTKPAWVRSSGMVFCPPNTLMMPSIRQFSKAFSSIYIQIMRRPTIVP